MAFTLIVDFGVGNVRSVERAVARLGYEHVVSAHLDDVERCSKIIIAGVGHFDTAMEKLRASGLDQALTHAVMVEKKPVLGICLGLEIMCGASEEGNARGLGWLDASYVKLRPQDSSLYKVPHIGWNSVCHDGSNKLMQGIPDGSEFYFLHSYHIESYNGIRFVGNVEYGDRFPAVIAKENIYGVQFHPEKSRDAGLALLHNFLSLK